MTDQTENLLPTIENRADLAVIAGWIEEGSSVLDLGCGEGSLLDYLIRRKKARAMGVDIDFEEIASCVKKGIPVLQMDLDESLDDFESGSFDYVIVSQTIHQLQRPDNLIEEILRIGKHAIVSFPNFGNFILRLKLFLTGRMPKSSKLPFEWYNTPNIHMSTFKDFKDFCRARNFKILKQLHIVGGKYKERVLLPNLFSEGHVVLIGK